MLGVDGVVPNEETILSGDYPLTRPLFIYVREDSLRDKQHVAEFVKFYIANAPELVADVDYVPVSTEQYDSARGAIARVLGVPAIETGLSGDVDIDGSSTVFPISEAVAEEFLSVNGRVRVQVGVSGTGGGFKRFFGRRDGHLGRLAADQELGARGLPRQRHRVRRDAGWLGRALGRGEPG